MTVLGSVRFSRAYYHRGHCHSGRCPRDAGLGPGGSDLSRGATAAALSGAVSSFAEAATKILPKLSGLRPSESTAERASERVGGDTGKRLAAGQTCGEPSPWKWSKDEEGRSVAYVSADLTGGQGGGGRLGSSSRPGPPDGQPRVVGCCSAPNVGV